MARLRKWFGIRARADASRAPSLERLRDETLAEAEAMANYALSSGKEVPRALMTGLEEVLKCADQPAAGTADIGGLAQVHQGLARIVHPATPRSILLLSRETDRPALVRVLGPVPLVRGLTIAAIISLAAWVGISLFSAVDGIVDWKRDFGVHLLVEELFLLSAAGLGASFAGLFQANRFVTRGTFDPKYSSTYWTRFVLGIVAGMILAMLVSGEASSLIDGGESFSDIGATLLAMLGGFSVRVVYRVLRRLVSTVETLVGGDPAAAVEAEIDAERSTVRAQQRAEQLRLGEELLDLRNELERDADPTSAGARRLKRITDDLLGSSSSCDSRANAPSPSDDAPSSSDGDAPSRSEDGAPS